MPNVVLTIVPEAFVRIISSNEELLPTKGMKFETIKEAQAYLEWVSAARERNNKPPIVQLTYLKYAIYQNG